MDFYSLDRPLNNSALFNFSAIHVVLSDFMISVARVYVGLKTQLTCLFRLCACKRVIAVVEMSIFARGLRIHFVAANKYCILRQCFVWCLDDKECCL